MAQYRKDIHALDATTKTRYEVMMLDEGLTATGTLTDAFGRLRISQPFTLFDSTHRYQRNDKWDYSLSGSGDITYNANASVVNLTTTSANGDIVIGETKRVFSYQPGKSLLILNTFAMANSSDNLIQRVGYFGANNGVFIEQNGANVAFVLRSNVTGTVTDTKVYQANWNVDTFDGSNTEYSTQSGSAFSSGLDLTKANIMWFDIEWLGVGDVRCGFVGNGKLIPAHVFKNPNLNASTYMTTATLPIRYEIRNTGTVGYSSSLKQICSTVISEGGYETKAKTYSVGRELGNTKDITAANTAYYPVVSIRLASDRLDSVIVPTNISLMGFTNNASYRYVIVLNASLTSPSWTTHSSNNVQYDISASTMSFTGSTNLNSGYLATDTKGGGVHIGSREDFSLQLGRFVSTGNSDIITLAVASDTAGADVVGSIEWKDLTNG